MATHDLKSFPDNFGLLLNGRLFEVRRNDRQFIPGDFVHVQEYLPVKNSFTGRTADFVIDDLAPFALPCEHPGDYVILHYRPIRVQLVKMELAPKVEKLPQPALQLYARVTEFNRAIQILIDVRGEPHQIFGSGIDPEGVEGSTGILAIMEGGFKRFRRVPCQHDFAGVYICKNCRIPKSLVP